MPSGFCFTSYFVITPSEYSTPALGSGFAACVTRSIVWILYWSRYRMYSAPSSTLEVVRSTLTLNVQSGFSCTCTLTRRPLLPVQGFGTSSAPPSWTTSSHLNAPGSPYTLSHVSRVTTESSLHSTVMAGMCCVTACTLRTA